MKMKHHIGGVIVYSPGASGLLRHELILASWRNLIPQ
jgi:hypothetical protein